MGWILGFIIVSALTLSGVAQTWDEAAYNSGGFLHSLSFLSLPFGAAFSLLIITLIGYLRGQIVFCVSCLAMLTVIEVTLKLAFPETANFNYPYRAYGVEWGFYPSGHVGRAVLMLLLAWPLLRAWMRPVAAVWVALAALYTAFAGAHFPSDVLGGALLGVSVVWSGKRLRERLSALSSG